MEPSELNARLEFMDLASNDTYLAAVHREHKVELEAMRSQRDQLLDHIREQDVRIDQLVREREDLRNKLDDARIHEKDVRGMLEQEIRNLESQVRLMTLHLPSNVLREIAEGKP